MNDEEYKLTSEEQEAESMLILMEEIKKLREMSGELSDEERRK